MFNFKFSKQCVQTVKEEKVTERVRLAVNASTAECKPTMDLSEVRPNSRMLSSEGRRGENNVIVSKKTTLFIAHRWSESSSSSVRKILRREGVVAPLINPSRPHPAARCVRKIPSRTVFFAPKPSPRSRKQEVWCVVSPPFGLSVCVCAEGACA